MFGDEPNTNVCPVCLGLPGSLPVLNQRAVELAMAIGTALHCEIRPSTFHRKNYFYPDQAKDYQISQYDEPINVDGWLELPDGTRVGIERAHMEEDTGKTSHAGTSGRIHGADYSLVDYNRSGVPLVEIVSRPDMRTADQARAYATELRAILVASGASDGKMEEGSMRVDANVSVRRAADDPFGTRCEIKNLNSVRSLGRAIEYEAERQIALLESGGDGRPADPPLGRGRRAGPRRCAPRRTPTTTATSSSRTWSRWCRTPSGSGRWRTPSGSMPAERRARLVGLLGGAGAVTDAQRDQIATVVDLGLDDLVVEAVAGGVGSALALARTANEAATDAEAARRARPRVVRGAPDPGGARPLTATQAKAVLGELLVRRRRRPGGHRPGEGLRGDVRGLAGGHRGRGGRRPPRRVGPLLRRATTSWPASSPDR